MAKKNKKNKILTLPKILLYIALILIWIGIFQFINQNQTFALVDLIFAALFIGASLIVKDRRRK